MPRVDTKTKSSRGKYDYTCSGCHDLIHSGEKYYIWCRRFGGVGRGTYFHKHVRCGYPRPSELSSAKTAIIEDAILDFPASSEVGDVDDIKNALQSIADVANEVGEEYAEGVGNMPESLQSGPTAAAMEEVAQELETWASELESWEEDAPLDEEGARDADWLEDQFANAQELLNDVPQFQG